MLQEMLSMQMLVTMGVMLAVYVAVGCALRCCSRGQKMEKVLPELLMEGALFVVAYHIVGMLLVRMGL